MEDEAKQTDKPADYSMQDGFGRKVDEYTYWRNTGLSPAAILRVKARRRRMGLKE